MEDLWRVPRLAPTRMRCRAPSAALFVERFRSQMVKSDKIHRPLEQRKTSNIVTSRFFWIHGIQSGKSLEMTEDLRTEKQMRRQWDMVG